MTAVANDIARLRSSPTRSRDLPETRAAEVAPLVADATGVAV
jgi:hypothetical protein